VSVGPSAAAANTMLAALIAAYPWIKLHVGDPGAAGTANAATETTRKQPTMAAPSGGSVANSAAVLWSSIAGSEDATHFSGWSASTAGSFGYSGTITAAAYVATNDYQIDIGGMVVSLPLAA
jgi:hypothetical protein